MGMIKNILFPVDFSQSCVAMGAYVKRTAALLGASVSLIHVFDPNGHSGLELSVRTLAEIADEHLEIARDRLDSFLQAEFPRAQHPRLIAAGEPATQIADTARCSFDLIIMPTHAGSFQRMLLGSTTANVLNNVDCPVLTSKHADTVTPRPTGHREWLCAIGVEHNSEGILRYAHLASLEMHGNLRIIHAIPAKSELPLQLDLDQRMRHEDRQRAHEWIDDLQRRVGSQAPVRIAGGSVKESLLEAAAEFEADVIVMGRSHRPGAHRRLSDLTYAVVRDSPFPVLSV